MRHRPVHHQTPEAVESRLCRGIPHTPYVSYTVYAEVGRVHHLQNPGTELKVEVTAEWFVLDLGFKDPSTLPRVHTTLADAHSFCLYTL